MSTAGDWDELTDEQERALFGGGGEDMVDECPFCGSPAVPRLTDKRRLDESGRFVEGEPVVWMVCPDCRSGPLGPLVDGKKAGCYAEVDR